MRRGRHRRTDGSGVRRWPPAADHKPRRPRARAAADAVELAGVSRPGAGLAAAAEGAVASAGAQRPAGGDVPARRSLVSGGVLLRGPQRAPDAGDAADPAHGARRLRAAGICCHRLRAGRVVGGAAAQCGATVRPGHAWRRSRDVAGRELDAAPDFSKCRGDRRADRAASSGGGEDAPAGDGELRPDLRRAAPPPAGPHPAARHARRCGGRTDRPVAHCGDADADQGADCAHGAVARVAAGGAGAAGDRPRERAFGCRRGEAAGGGRGDHRGGDRRSRAPGRSPGQAPVKTIHRGNVMRRRPVQASLFSS